MMRSPPSCLNTSFATVNPPTPESNMPTAGWSSRFISSFIPPFCDIRPRRFCDDGWSRWDIICDEDGSRLLLHPLVQHGKAFAYGLHVLRRKPGQNLRQ